jgi:hypothetical protein
MLDEMFPRALVYGGATLLGPGLLKLFAAHVIDKGGPNKVLPKEQLAKRRPANSGPSFQFVQPIVAFGRANGSRRA